MDDLIASVRAVLATTPNHWRSLTETLPDELLTRAPAEGEWSALECLQHLLDTERMVFPVRVRSLQAGRDLPAFDPDAQGTTPQLEQSLQEMAASFAQLRAESLELLASVTNDEFGNSAHHEELGQVTLEELLHEWAAHDLMHTVQAERALMQPFIVGSGPWRHYFADHDSDRPENS